MKNAIETPLTTVVVPPCPEWCDAAPGHDYDTDIPSTTGALERHHNWDPPFGDFAAWASIGACEISLGGVAKVDAPYIYASSDQEMTAVQARLYAAEFL